MTKPQTLDEFLAEIDREPRGRSQITIRKLIALVRALKEQRDYYEWMTLSSLTLAEGEVGANDQTLLAIINEPGNRA